MLLDASAGFHPPPVAQLRASQQALRFFDAQVAFDDAEQDVLLQVGNIPYKPPTEPN